MNSTQILGCYFVILCVIHALIVHGGFIEYSKGESNFFSSRARSQAALYSDAKIVLLGSSITGRIPNCDSGNNLIANFGADGKTFESGFSWLYQRGVRTGDFIFIETNMIHGMTNSDFPPITQWENLGAKIPLLRANYRPSGLLYSLLRNYRDADDKIRTSIQDFDYKAFLRMDGSVFEPDASHADLLAQLKKIKQSGANIIFVEYPSGRRSLESMQNRLPLILWLRKELDIPFYDFTSMLGNNKITLSDGVHLDSKSAYAFAEILAKISSK